MATITGKEIDWIAWDELDGETFKDLYEGKWATPDDLKPVFKLPKRLRSKDETSDKCVTLSPLKSGKTEALRRSLDTLSTSATDVGESIRTLSKTISTVSSTVYISNLPPDDFLDTLRYQIDHRISEAVDQVMWKKIVQYSEPEPEPEPDRGDLWGTW